MNTRLNKINKMTDGEIGVAILVKKYGVIMIAVIWGAVSHVIVDVKKNGWKGIGWVLADVTVAMFIGALFAHICSKISPEYITEAGAVGGYMGPYAFKYVRIAFFNKIGLQDPVQK
jgi:hypothetical protein